MYIYVCQIFTLTFFSPRITGSLPFGFARCWVSESIAKYGMNSGFSVHWHWNTHDVGYKIYDRRGLGTHLVNTSWVFSMNTKLRFTVFIIHIEFKIKYIHLYDEISLSFKILSKLFSVNALYIEKLVESSHGYWCILQCLLWSGCYGCTIVMSYNG